MTKKVTVPKSAPKIGEVWFDKNYVSNLIILNNVPPDEALERGSTEVVNVMCELQNFGVLIWRVKVDYKAFSTNSHSQYTMTLDTFLSEFIKKDSKAEGMFLLAQL